MRRRKVIFGSGVFILLVCLAVGAWFWLGKDYVLENTINLSWGQTDGVVQGDIQQKPIDREFSILIPRLKVNAPVKANVDGSGEWRYAPRILKGVAHYGPGRLGGVEVDGALPGEKGNIFLFGHSQIPGGDMSDYRGVFNNLSDLEEGDVIQVYHQGKEYKYKVSYGQVVDKTALKYLAPTEKETLTLMSCWPLGLDLKRYIIRAERV